MFTLSISSSSSPLPLCPMLGGSLVTTAWRVLRLRMEETPYSFGVQLRIYSINSCGQPTSGGPPALGLGVGLTTPRLKKQACYENSQETSDLDGFFG
jgi:hypothetical protein